MKIILSCTTTANRLDIFYYGVQSLINQTLKPDLFILNLSEDDFGENGKHSIPIWLQNGEIKINLTKDIGPYTKLIPTFNFATDDDIIVTADDDILYHSKWLERLVEISEENQDMIICSRARLMRENIFNKWMNYSNWENATNETMSFDLLPLGVGGVVYKKRLLDMSFLLNNDYLSIAPGTDDLWFKMASLRKKTMIKVIPEIDIYNMRIHHKKGLGDINVKKNRVNSILKLPQYVFVLIKNYFGISVSINDENWKRIISFNKVN